MPSPAVASRLERLAFIGTFTAANASARGATLVAVDHGAVGAEDHINLTLLVDAGGVIKDARFTSPAVGDLRAAYDAMCELAVGKPVTEAAAISPAQAEALLRGNGDSPAFPLALDATKPFYVLIKAAERFAATPVAPPQSPFASCGLFEKVKRIEQVLDAHVRPALASDGGGLDLVDLQGDDLHVQYHGACGSCSSSVGGTLTFIQDSLNNHLAASLVVKVSGMDEAAPSLI
jgi:Fe-S cluster biogenesis protein NfuA/NifU-like protein involved in Fe-S cluster formation